MVGKKPYSNGSVMHLAVIGFTNLKNLSKSSLISEKLIGFNALMFVIIASIIISFWLNTSINVFSISYLFTLSISILISLIISLLYSPALELLSNFSGENKINSLRLGLMVLFIDLPISVGAIVLENDLLNKISFIFVWAQLAIVLFGGFIKYSKETTHDKEVNATDLWVVIDKISAICGIVSFIITIIFLIFGKQSP